MNIINNKIFYYISSSNLQVLKYKQLSLIENKWSHILYDMNYLFSPFENNPNIYNKLFSPFGNNPNIYNNHEKLLKMYLFLFLLIKIRVKLNINLTHFKQLLAIKKQLLIFYKTSKKLCQHLFIRQFKNLTYRKGIRSKYYLKRYIKKKSLLCKLKSKKIIRLTKKTIKLKNLNFKKLFVASSKTFSQQFYLKNTLLLYKNYKKKNVIKNKKVFFKLSRVAFRYKKRQGNIKKKLYIKTHVKIMKKIIRNKSSCFLKRQLPIILTISYIKKSVAKPQSLFVPNIWRRFRHFNQFPRLLLKMNLKEIYEKQSRLILKSSKYIFKNFKKLMYVKKGLYASFHRFDIIQKRSLKKLIKPALAYYIFNQIKYNTYYSYKSLRADIKKLIRNELFNFYRCKNFYKLRKRLNNRNKKELEMLIVNYRQNRLIKRRQLKFIKNRKHYFHSFFSTERKLLKIYRTQWEKFLFKRFPFKAKKYEIQFYFPSFSNYNYLYKNQLRAQQRFRWLFRLSYKQLISLFRKARLYTKNRKELRFLKSLELRIDVILFRLNFVASLAQARQIIKKSWFLVNGKIIKWPTYLLNVGDIVIPTTNIRTGRPSLVFWYPDFGLFFSNLRLFQRQLQVEHYPSYLILNERIPAAIVISNPNFISKLHHITEINIQYLIISLLKYR